MDNQHDVSYGEAKLNATTEDHKKIEMRFKTPFDTLEQLFEEVYSTPKIKIIKTNGEEFVLANGIKFVRNDNYYYCPNCDKYFCGSPAVKRNILENFHLYICKTCLAAYQKF